MADATQKKQPTCHGCLHFYITHEPAFPYGCKALNFKSAQYPAVTVFASSGMACQLFVRKTAVPKVRG